MTRSPHRAQAVPAFAPRAWRRVICAALLATSQTAHANWFDLYGVAGPSQQMASAQTAASEDWSAAFYNPANLTLAREARLGMGWAFVAPALQIAVARTDPQPAPQVPSFASGLTAGLSLPLPGKLSEYVSFGLVSFFPVGTFLKARMQDAATPHFYLHDSRSRTFGLYLGAGVRITDWLRLGAGLNVLADITGPANISLDLPNGRFTSKYMDADLVLKAAPTAGVTVSPIEGLRLSASYRGAISIDINIPATVKMDGLDADLQLTIRGNTLYSPHTLNFGASYTLPMLPLTLALDAQYRLWSLAPDPSLQVALTLSGADIEKLGLKGVLDAPAPGNERKIALGFANTLGIKFGAQYVVAPWLTVRAGYQFRPTPAPVQTSGTNIIDNDAHIPAAGATFSFKDPLAFFAGTFSIDLSAQATLMAQRDHVKDSQDDPVGNFASGGAIFGGSVMLRYAFGNAPPAPSATPPAVTSEPARHTETAAPPSSKEPQAHDAAKDPGKTERPSTGSDRPRRK